MYLLFFIPIFVSLSPLQIGYNRVHNYPLINHSSFLSFLLIAIFSSFFILPIFCHFSSFSIIFIFYHSSWFQYFLLFSFFLSSIISLELTLMPFFHRFYHLLFLFFSAWSTFVIPSIFYHFSSSKLSCFFTSLLSPVIPLDFNIFLFFILPIFYNFPWVQNYSLLLLFPTFIIPLDCYILLFCHSFHLLSFLEFKIILFFHRLYLL